MSCKHMNKQTQGCYRAVLAARPQMSTHVARPVQARFSRRATTCHAQHDIGRRAAMMAVFGAPLFANAAKAGLLQSKPAPELLTGIPVIDVPMQRLRLPPGGVGSDYALIKMTVQNQGPFDWMIDSGLTAELITPHLQEQLGIRPSGRKVAGLGAGGAVDAGGLVALEGAAIVGDGARSSSRGNLPLPTLSAVVTPFPQEHLDPAHDPVEGMIGQELLQMYDADLDFPAGRFRLWTPGDGAEVAAQAGMVTIPAAVLNETGLLGIRVTSTAAAKRGSAQPVVGIIDSGASFSAVNWQAAQLLGLPPRDDKAYGKGPTIFSVGVDGRPMPLPTTQVQLTFTGNPQMSPKGAMVFEQPAGNWQPWKPINVAVGDLPVFSQLLGDGRTPFTGPAALIGLDVLSQRRVILGAASGPSPSRRRQLYVTAK